MREARKSHWRKWATGGALALLGALSFGFLPRALLKKIILVVGIILGGFVALFAVVILVMIVKIYVIESYQEWQERREADKLATAARSYFEGLTK
jgi:membrane protein YdbS with pleckstrin-like domain